MYSDRLQQVLPRERPLRRTEKRDEQGVFALCQLHRGAVRVGQTPTASIELPSAKSTTGGLPIPLWLFGCPSSAAQHSLDTRQQFTKADGLGDPVIGTKLEPDNPVA
jgi:hypothetical protein